MNTKQAAKELGVSLTTVKDWILSGKLPAQKIKTTTNRHGYVWNITSTSITQLRRKLVELETTKMKKHLKGRRKFQRN
jgi:predicted site-specific integrase-resolvase